MNKDKTKSGPQFLAHSVPPGVITLSLLNTSGTLYLCLSCALCQNALPVLFPRWTFFLHVDLICGRC